MALSINTNIFSLIAQRNLTGIQDPLQTAMQRLSSGLRINSAKDDAAGLAISNRMESQIRGLNMAVSNANDGVSLAQTAEGALGQIGTNLQRIRELAIKSANSTNSASDRAAIQQEASQLLAEVDRTAQTTQFNGRNILDGTFSSAQFQVGANANQIISFGISGAQQSQLGAYQANNSSSPTLVSGAALAAGQLTINGVDVGTSVSGSAQDIATSINGVSSQTGVNATASSTLTGGALTRNQTLQSGDLVINSVNIGAVAGSNNLATQGQNIATAINAVSNQTGVSATANQSTGVLTLTSSVGKNIAITSSNSNAGGARVLNASGLAVDTGSTQATSVTTLDVAGSTPAYGTNTLALTGTGTQLSGSYFTLQGTTYEINTGAAAAGHTVITVLAADTAIQVATKVVTALGGISNAVASNGGGTLSTVTTTSNVYTTTMTNVTMSGATAGAGGGTIVAAVGTAGAGIAVGSTLTLGGVTYEFTFDNGTPVTSGATKVSLGAAAGSTGTTVATNLNNAINNNYTNGNTNIQSVAATNTVTSTSDLKGASGTSAVTATGTALTAALTNGTFTGGSDGTYAATTGYGSLLLSSPTQFIVAGTSPNVAGLSGATSTLTKLSTVDISTVTGANNSIAVLDGAISQVSSIRAGLGAVQNRFQSTISNLSSVSQNMSAAKSRIMDADYAAETANMTKSLIMQQAGISVLAQSNTLPQQVLALLK